MLFRLERRAFGSAGLSVAGASAQAFSPARSFHALWSAAERLEEIMKQYLAVFLGKPEAMNDFRNLPEAERKEREQRGMQAWMKWAQDNQTKIKQMGSPLGKTLKVDRSGVAPTRNDLGGWTVVEAESHEDAAKLFAGHPHFTIFPGDRVEVMEILPIPSLP
jgi:leucyl aminopeptidase (aminopeptidase T)